MIAAGRSLNAMLAASSEELTVTTRFTLRRAEAPSPQPFCPSLYRTACLNFRSRHRRSSQVNFEFFSDFRIPADPEAEDEQR